jgi:hypothetical protein
MSELKARQEFIALMAAEGIPLDVSLKVMRYATTMQRIAVKECNEGLTPDDREKDDWCEGKIKDLLTPLKCTPIFNGDPRGAVVKIKVPSGHTDDWGQTGICVP